jgi:hypothetical protein
MLVLLGLKLSLTRIDYGMALILLDHLATTQKLDLLSLHKLFLRMSLKVFA